MDAIRWLEPWEEIPDEASRRSLERELRREVAPSHPVYACVAEALAHRTDCDDVLFSLDHGRELAVVHLTYASAVPEPPPWPATTLFATADEFVSQRLMPDHDDFTGAGG